MPWLRNQLMSITSAICDTILNCQPKANPLFANSLGDVSVSGSASQSQPPGPGLTVARARGRVLTPAHSPLTVTSLEKLHRLTLFGIF